MLVRGDDMVSKLMEYFNKQPRIGILSTSNNDGKVDSALFGSPHMIDEETIIVATSKNRTFGNLLENPNAVYIIMEQYSNSPETENMQPGSSVMDWQGIRVYMRMKEYSTTGEMLEMMRRQAANFAGEEAAKMIYASVTFKVYEVRPLVDFGQGWENSI